MCGRFLLRCPPESWPADLFGPEQPLPSLPASDEVFTPRWNIAPTQKVLAVVQRTHDAPRELRSFQWGLVPSWSRDRKIGAKMINARSETVHEKPSFRAAFAKRRCLIPADGYYEWVKTEHGKQPMLIEREGSKPFCFAGLWELCFHLPVERDGQVDPQRPLATCTILTTAANHAMRPIHDRMPVVIEPEHYARWLDPEFSQPKALQELLLAAEEDYFIAAPVERV
ncbi:MAG: SOS response-associated peptidase [Planctomycetaceae bacterium]